MVVEVVWDSLDGTVNINLVLWSGKSWIDHPESLVNCLNSLIGSVLQAAHNFIGHFSGLLVDVVLGLMNLSHSILLSRLNHISVLGYVVY